jgi:hypothetical protein
MQRQIVYTTALPRSTDILQMQTNMMYAVGYALQAAIGTMTVVDGLACTVGSGVSVNIGSGSIIQSETVDQNSVAFGSLPLDTNTIMKMGIATSATNFVLAVPGTAGQSVNYLIEAQLTEQDALPTVLPYYNASNPGTPWSGPSNSGTSQNTQRQQIVALQLKAGAAATTGTQATPGADSGWVPLWIITVSYGQSAVNSSNIYRAPASPFLGTKVGQLRYKLTGNLTLYVTTTGNDSTNNGLSSNTAFATPQAAWNALINNYDLNGYNATINIANGTYSSATGLTCSGQPAGLGSTNTITITGAGSSTIISATAANSQAISAASNAIITVSNLTVTASGASSNGITAYGGCTITDAGIYYGACANAHRCANSGLVYIFGNSVITGAALFHFATIHGGQIVCAASTVTNGSGALAFSSAFASALTGIIDLSNGHSFSGTGSFTGTRYNAQFGGAINTGAGGASFFPGNAAGTVNSGTAYQGFYN